MSALAIALIAARFVVPGPVSAQSISCSATSCNVSGLAQGEVGTVGGNGDNGAAGLDGGLGGLGLAGGSGGSGANGEPGVSGYTGGAAGADGTAGTVGTPGTAGAAGTVGLAGSNGAAGVGAGEGQAGITATNADVVVTSSGVVQGGAGGNAGTGGNGGIGGAGGSGGTGAMGGSGGNGGAGGNGADGAAAPYYTAGGKGGDGGIGGTGGIGGAGGIGGLGGIGGTAGIGGSAAAGGAGITGTGLRLRNSGTITGGNGGASGNAGITGTAGSDGVAGPSGTTGTDGNGGNGGKGGNGAPAILPNTSGGLAGLAGLGASAIGNGAAGTNGSNGERGYGGDFDIVRPADGGRGGNAGNGGIGGLRGLGGIGGPDGTGGAGGLGAIGGSAADGGAGIVLNGAGNAIWNEGQITGGAAGSVANNAGAGIQIQSGAVVTELYNIGTISGGAGLNSYGILNDGGSIEKLANAQGGNAPALTYFGDLPQNHIILITGPGTYGQLAVQSATSAQSMTVGIESTAAQGLSTGQYANVITGVHAENITNAGSVFNLANGVIATLIPNQDPSATAWDARILNYGADIVEPQHTLLDRNASVLRAQIRNYDCERFASAGLCIASGIRYQSLGQSAAGGGEETTSGISLIIAKQLISKLRLGAFIDFGNDPADVASIDVTSHHPIFGGFIGYADRPDGSGLQTKIAAAYKRDEASFTRANIVGPGGDVSADSGFETIAVNAIAGWGFRAPHSILITPYLGFTMTEASRRAFSEAPQSQTGPDNGLAYGRYTAKQASGVAGLRINAQISSQVTGHLGAAIDHDYAYDLNAFTLRTPSGTSNSASTLKPRQNRASGSAGLDLRVTPNNHLSLNSYVSQSNYGHTDEYTVVLAYKIGL